MTYPRLRLTVAACLFVGWMGFLAYLVVRTRDPVILSRPQLLYANLILRVEVQDKDGWPAAEVRVKETLWSGQGVKPPSAGETIRLAEIVDVGREQGWRGAGDYIVPLTVVKEGESYQVTGLPRSPGFLPRAQLEITELGGKPEQVLEWIKANTRLSLDEAKKASAKEPRVLLRNVDGRDLSAIEEKLDKLGAAVHRRAGEYRIYAATADALEQVKVIQGGARE